MQIDLKHSVILGLGVGLGFAAAAVIVGLITK